MKFLIYAAFILSGLFLISCHKTNEIYIVRHAEKSKEPANDPPLTGQGTQRAEALKDLLKDKNIQAIFSTNTTRTIQTASPLSKLVNIPIRYYSNDTLANFLQSVFTLKKNTLIVGHSNTCITMINSLELPHTITNIADDAYDNLFIIKVKDGKPIKIIETTFGLSSKPVK